MARRSAPYCGGLRAGPGDLTRRAPGGGVAALFAGRRAGFSFSTRVALRQACDLLGLGPGDEVLAPAYNCGSELDPLLAAGLTVTLYPVDRRTRIDPDAVARRIGPRTRAVYVTHYFGVPHPETEALRALCDRHGLALIEDCALSLLSGAHPAEGRLGDVAVFCFYKFFPTLAGGALVINSDRIAGQPQFPAPPPRGAAGRHLLGMGLDLVPGARTLRGALLRALRPPRGGPDPLSAAPGLPDMPAPYYYDTALTDAGASGLTRQALRSFDVAATIATRRAHYRDWLEALADLPGVTPLFPELDAETCPLAMPVVLEGRDGLAAALTARGIAATPWWAGYNRRLDFEGQDAARHLKDHVLALPVHQQLGSGAVAHMAGQLRALVTPGSRPPTAAPGRRPAAGGP